MMPAPAANGNHPMDNENAREEIARLEERIAELSERIARCRKLSLAAKIAIVTGAAWLALTLLWLVPFLPAPVFAAIAAAIGGVVLLGSNKTTWEQTEAALRQAETARSALIERMELRVVDAGARRLH
jgi:hypothetical protein